MFLLVKPIEKVGTHAGALEVVDEVLDTALEPELIAEIVGRTVVDEEILVEDSVPEDEMILEDEGSLTDEDVCIGVADDAEAEAGSESADDDTVDDVTNSVLDTTGEDCAALLRRPVQTWPTVEALSTALLR